jgi:hypothetical protein
MDIILTACPIGLFFVVIKERQRTDRNQEDRALILGNQTTKIILYPNSYLHV